MGFKEETDLDAAIKTTDAAIRRARNKELGIEEEEKVSSEGPYLFGRFFCFAFIHPKVATFPCENELAKAQKINLLTM
jgi:hypothetical protein